VNDDGSFYISAHGVVCCDDREIQEITAYGYCAQLAASTDLLAGQNYYAGTVTAYIDEEEQLWVLYTTDDGWEMTEAQLFIDGGEFLEEDNYCPDKYAPGKFPYKVENLPDGTTEYEFGPYDVYDWAPVNENGEPTGEAFQLCFAAHAVVRREIECPPGVTGPCYQSETGWGVGDEQSKQGWGMCFCGTVYQWRRCDEDEKPPVDDCETIWAYGNEDFHNWDWSRWGWMLDAGYGCPE
jgi:hypothetical protein